MYEEEKNDFENKLSLNKNFSSDLPEKIIKVYLFIL